MLANTDLTTSVLLIEANDVDRKFYTEGLISSSPDYRIVGATDAEAGLALYRSQRIDYVVLELDFEDRSGFIEVEGQSGYDPVSTFGSPL